MVHHLFMSGTIDSANRTDRLAIVDLQMTEQVRSVDVIDAIEGLKTDAAGFRILVRGSVGFDLDAG